MRKPKYELRLLQAAEADLNELLDYLAAHNLRAANTLLDKFEKRFGLLQAQAYLGRVPNDIELMRLGYYSLVIEEYLVFYTVQKQIILVHRILHGARSYESLLLSDRF